MYTILFLDCTPRLLKDTSALLLFIDQIEVPNLKTKRGGGWGVGGVGGGGYMRAYNIYVLFSFFLFLTFYSNYMHYNTNTIQCSILEYNTIGRFRRGC